MKNWKSIFGLAALTVGLASGGELFEVEEVPEQAAVADIAMGRHNVDLMVGDSYTLPATITPDSLINKGLFWEVADTNIVSIDNGTIMAKAPGETAVRVTAVAGMKNDTCHVNVHRWDFDPYQFRYDMVIYADVTVGGKAPESGTMVAAFGYDETGAQQIRGLGVMRQAGDQKYMQLRLYSNEEGGDTLSLRCYDRQRLLMVKSKDAVSFESNVTLGTLSMLYSIDFE